MISIDKKADKRPLRLIIFMALTFIFLLLSGTLFPLYEPREIECVGEKWTDRQRYSSLSDVPPGAECNYAFGYPFAVYNKNYIGLNSDIPMGEGLLPNLIFWIGTAAIASILIPLDGRTVKVKNRLERGH